MDVLRTPEEPFADLPGFDFEPHYVEVPWEGAGIRVHYLDEGPSDQPDAPTVLLMHGEPTWSFLYRHMIPVLVGAGLRCVAPDLVGFGRSDKPAKRTDVTYRRMVEWMRAALFSPRDDGLDLSGLTLVGQDWGALIGLRLLAEHPDRFDRAVLSNGGLPTGDQRVGDAFLAWLDFSQNAERFPIGGIVNGGCTTDLAPEVVAGYDAPFPDDRYKEAARQMPSLVPIDPDNEASADNRRAWEVLSAWEKPLLCAFTDSDPITKGADKPFRSLVPGAHGQPHTTIEGAGHFVQEDAGPELARIVAEFVENRPS
jgi:haloalkane dehalogenase